MKKLNIQYTDSVINKTNYKKSEFNYSNLCYLLFAETCYHLFVPDQYLSSIDEMAAGKYAVLTQGYHKSLKGEILEIMFEDFSATPFAIHLSMIQTSDISFKADETKKIRLIIHGLTLNVLEMDLYIRSGSNYPLPFLNPIDTDFIDNVIGIFKSFKDLE
jgi:hypothetical protein